MLSNVRIRDNGRLATKRERPERTLRTVKTTKLSPFSELVLSTGRTLDSSSSPLPSLTQFTYSISDDPRVDHLADRIRECRLRDRNEAEGRGQGRQGKRRDSLLLLEQRQQSSPPLLPADPGRGGGGRGEPSPSTPQSSAAALEQLSSASDRTGSLKRAVVRLKRRSVQELMSEHSTPSSSRRGSDVMTERLTPCSQSCTQMCTPHTLTSAQTPHSSTSPSPLLSYLSPSHSLPLSPREKILSLCEQTQTLPLSSFFTLQMVKSVQKLGEGTFSEVFGCNSGTGDSLAIKIIPIEGSQLYNGEPQTSYQDVLTEMAIAKELSLLGDQAGKENCPHFTENFLKIHRMALLHGAYPDFLLDAWTAYSSTHTTENDSPDLFPDDQLYVAIATDNAGTSLENYQLSKVEEAISVLCQVAGALAVGETALEMEHRDLHMSNVLVKETREKSFTFQLNERAVTILSHGVKATIVDYTLSRMKQDDCVCFTDLEKLQWLFEGKGDLQFKVYRDMRKTTGAKWEQFKPSTNVLWLVFLVAKLSDKAREIDPGMRRSWRTKLRPLLRNLSRHSSAQDAFLNLCSTL